MKTTAAVLVETGKPLELAELEIPILKPGQVIVQLAYSGVCHTQILESRGRRGPDPYVPHCLGHEGSGTVVQVAAGVSKVKPGDNVIMSWIKGSGADIPGTVYAWGNRKVNSGAITTFGEYSVVSENRLTVMDTYLPMREAALVGCAVATGAGAVFNAATARPGQSIAVFGAGGVGLSAISAAHAAGCHPIIAVDILALKLDFARTMGATHTIDSSRTDVGTAIDNIAHGGVDIAIEATGRPEVMVAALGSARQQGGCVVVIGNAPAGQTLVIDPKQLNMGKRLLGTWGGDSRPDIDYPRYSKLIVAGKLNVTPLISTTYSLRDINAALDDLENGVVCRPLIDFNL